METYTAGIDVSHWQGVIGWEALAEGGCAKFAYIKATDGEFGLDPQFNRNWSKSRDAKIPRGAYHFFRPVEVDSQIRSAIAAIGAPGDDPGELPPALDVEVGAMDRAEFDSVLEWLQAIQAFYGRAPLLYLNRSGIRDLDNAAGPTLHQDQAWLAQFGEFPLWLADYSGGAKPVRPPGPWDEWTFWQHTPQGSAPGLASAVDLDYFHGPDLTSLLLPRTATPAAPGEVGS